MQCALSKEQRLSLRPPHLAWGWAGCSGGGSFLRPPLLKNPTCSAGGGAGCALQQSLKMAKAASPQRCQALLAKGWLFSCGYDEGLQLPRSPPSFSGAAELAGESFPLLRKQACQLPGSSTGSPDLPVAVHPSLCQKEPFHWHPGAWAGGPQVRVALATLGGAAARSREPQGIPRG